MQIAGDPVPIGDHIEFAHPALGIGQLPGQGRLIGEGRHHLQLFVGELAGSPVTQDHHDAGDGLGGSQRQNHGGAGAVDERRHIIERAEPIRSAGGEGRADRGVRDRKRWWRTGWAVPPGRLHHQQFVDLLHGYLGVGRHRDEHHIGTVEITRLIGDEPEDLGRFVAAEQLGGDIARCRDPRLAGTSLFVEPGIVDGDSGSRRQCLGQHLVVLGER